MQNITYEILQVPVGDDGTMNCSAIQHHCNDIYSLFSLLCCITSNAWEWLVTKCVLRFEFLYHAEYGEPSRLKFHFRIIERIKSNNNSKHQQQRSRMHSDVMNKIKCIAQCTLQYPLSISLDNTLVYPYVTIHEQYFIGNDF